MTPLIAAMVDPTKREHNLAAQLDEGLVAIEARGLSREEHTTANKRLLASALAAYRVERDHEDGPAGLYEWCRTQVEAGHSLAVIDHEKKRVLEVTWPGLEAASARRQSNDTTVPSREQIRTALRKGADDLERARQRGVIATAARRGEE